MKTCSHRIARNHTSTIITPNDEERKRLRTKIPTCTLSRGSRKLRTRAKRLTISESHEILQVPYLGQMTKKRSDRTRKFQPVRSREGQDIYAHARSRYKIDLLRIGRNRTSTPIGQNDEYWKQSRAKIVTGALPGEPGNIVVYAST